MHRDVLIMFAAPIIHVFDCGANLPTDQYLHVSIIEPSYPNFRPQLPLIYQVPLISQHSDGSLRLAMKCDMAICCGEQRLPS